MDDLLRDNRFAHIPKDPRFRQMKREERKVKIDKRFRGMFQDKRFKLKYSVDKRGRPIHTSTNENLKNYYELSSSESGESSEEVEEEGNEEETHSVDESPSRTESLSREKSNKAINKKHKSYGANNEEISSFAAKKTKSKRTSLAEPQCSSAQAKLKTKKMDKAATKSKPSSTRKNVQSQKITPHTEISTDEEEEGEEEEEDEEEEGDTDDESSSSGGDEENELDSEGEAPAIKESTSGMGPDYARGEAVLESSSSDDEGDDDEDEELDHGWGELDKEAPEAENVTRRLAVCNMDWDRIKANDLLVLFNSFKPTGGVIHSVKIYPSEFGQQRMAEEAVKGPTELVTHSETEEKVDSENVEGEHYHREKLRQYQLNRLKYYYAVMECDSPKTANHIYEECDGIEYESSSTKMDLRFIPDEMVFDQEPKSVAQEVPDVSTYKPSLFTTTALQQSKVDLTWDETDRDRVTVTMRKFDKDELEEMDVKAYLASDSDVEEDPYGDLVAEDDFGHISEEEDDEAQIQKYRQLLLGGKASKTTSKADGEEDMEMEITWEPGLKETTEELVKKKAKQKSAMTPWEEYLEKKKDKKMAKKEEKDKKKKQKGNGVEEGEKNLPHAANDASESEEDLPAGIDLNDPYFKDELEGSEPTAKKSESKSGKGSSSGKKKKKKRAKGLEDKGQPEDQDELSLLLMDEDDQKQHFSLKAIIEQESESKQKKKRKKKKQAVVEENTLVKDTFQVDVQDDRFSALFEDPHYNIDPSAPEFKKTKAMESLISEKQKRRERKREKPVQTSRPSSNPAGDAEVASKKAKLTESSTAEVKHVDSTQRTKDPALANLIKSVKAKTQTLQEKKKRKKTATFRPK